MNVWLPFLGRTVTVGLVLTIISACGTAGTSTTTQGGQPASASTSSVTVASTVPAPATTVTSPPRVVVVDLDQEGFAAPIWDDSEYGDPVFTDTLSDLAATGAEWVTLVPTWYQTAPESSVLYAERPGRTSTDEALIAAISEARELGLEVMLKPHVDVTDGGSRSRIDPTDHEQWFESYGEFIVAYARLAEQHGVSQFVVGTELAGTSSDTDEWRSLIGQVREVYAGAVTYAANHDEYQDVEFWDALDIIGIDAYFPLADEPTSDVDQLTGSWDQIVEDLAALARASDRSIVFTEVGYPSQEGAVTAPFNPELSTNVSDEEQEAALLAMLSAVEGEDWFGGFHWWMWFEEDSETEHDLGYTPQGKPSETILRARWDQG